MHLNFGFPFPGCEQEAEGQHATRENRQNPSYIGKRQRGSLHIDLVAHDRQSPGFRVGQCPALVGEHLRELGQTIHGFGSIRSDFFYQNRPMEILASG